MTDLHQALVFASDAQLLAAAGVAMLTLAMLALHMDRRRLKRGKIDRVGWVPWTGLFLLLVICGGGILALAAPAMLAG